MHPVETSRNKRGGDSDTDPNVDIMKRQAVKAMTSISCEVVQLHSPLHRCGLEAPQADLKALEAENVRIPLMSNIWQGGRGKPIRDKRKIGSLITEKQWN